MSVINHTIINYGIVAIVFLMLVKFGMEIYKSIVSDVKKERGKKDGNIEHGNDSINLRRGNVPIGKARYGKDPREFREEKKWGPGR